MTKSETILNAIDSGTVTDEELLVLENTPEDQFTVETKEEVTTAPEVKEDLSPENTTAKEENTVFNGEDDSSVTSGDNVIKGCMDILATNYSSKATEDDGSCLYLSSQITTIDINAKTFIDYENPVNKEAKIKYEEHKTLVDVDNIEGVDPEFLKNIVNTDIQFGKDRNGNEDSDVNSTTSVGGIVETLDNDGSRSYHYTEDHEKYSKSIFNFLGLNKADDEDIALFDAQRYMYRLDEAALKQLKKYKADTPEGKALLDDASKAEALSQLEFQDINIEDAEIKTKEVNNRIQTRNKELNYSFKSSEDVEKEIEKLNLLSTTQELDKKQKEQLESLSKHKDDLYVVEKLNTRIEQINSNETVTKLTEEAKSTTKLKKQDNRYDPTDFQLEVQDNMEAFIENRDIAIKQATDEALAVVSDETSKVRKEAEAIFIPQIEALYDERPQAVYNEWAQENVELLEKIKSDANDFYAIPENVYALLETENRAKLEALDKEQEEIRNGTYTSEAQVNRANKKLDKLQEKRKKILEPLDVELNSAFNEKINKEVNDLYRNSEEYKNLVIDVNKKADVINEAYSDHLSVEHNKIFQGLINKKMKKFQEGAIEISDKEFKNFDLVLDNIGYNKTTDTDAKRKILDAAWDAISKDYTEADVKGEYLEEKREAFYFKYYADVMYNKDGSMSSAAIKDSIIDMVNSSPENIYRLENEIENIKKETGFDFKALEFQRTVSPQTLTAEENEFIEKIKELEEEEKQWQDLKETGKEIIDNPSYYEVKNGNAFTNLWRGFSSGKLVEYAPYLSGIADINKNLDVLALYKKQASGEKLSELEKFNLTLLNMDEEQKAAFSKISKSYRTGLGLKDMLPFVGEMASSFGAYNLAKKGAEKTLQAIVKAAIKNSNLYKKSVTKGVKAKIKNGAINSLSTIWGTLIHGATANTQNVIAGTIKDMTPEMQLMFTTDGDDIMYEAGFVTIEAVNSDIKEVQAQIEDPKTTSESKKQLQERLKFLKEKKEGITYNDADFNLIFLENFGVGWAEYFSERLGGAIPNFGVKRAFIRKLEKNGPDWLKRTLVSTYLKKKGVTTFKDAVDSMVNFADDRIAWNGFMGEVLEEVVNQPLQNLITGNKWNDGITPQFFGDITRVTAAAQVAFGGINMSMNIGKKTPGYGFRGRTFKTYEAMMRSVKSYSKKSWKEDEASGLEFPKINISNDNNSFISTFDFLEKNNIDTKGLINEDVEARRKDRNAAHEAKIITLLHEDNKSEEVKELDQIEKDKTKIDEKIEQTTSEEAINDLKKEKATLDQRKEVIISPYVKQVVTEQFEADVAKVREGLVQIDDVTGVETRVEVTDDAGVKQFVRQDMLANMGIVAAEGGEFLYQKTGEKVGIKALRDINEQVDGALEKSNHGFIGKPRDGKRTIIINRDNAINGGAYNVASHEFLHAVLFKTLNDNPATQLAVGQALGSYIQNLDFSTIKDAKFLKRVVNYQRTMGEGVASEEVITLFADALKTGDIQYNETVADKIGDVIRRVMSRAGVELSFGDGRDIFNFVKDFNYNVEKGNWTEIAKAAKGIKLEGEIKEYADLYTGFYESLSPENQEKYSLSRDPNEFENFAQNIYEDPNLNLTTKAFLIARLYDPRVKFDKQGFENPNGSVTAGGIRISKELKKYSKLPDYNVFEQEIIDDIINGLPRKKEGETDIERIKRGRSILSIVASYDPLAKDAKGNKIPVTGWVGSVLSKRGISESVSKFIKEDAGFKTELSGAKELVAETTTETKQTTKAQRARELSSLSSVYGITNSIDLNNKIKSIIKQNPKNLDFQLKKLIQEDIRKALVKQMGAISKVKGEVVVSEEYKAFIALNYETIVQSLDVATIKNNYKTLFELTKIGKEKKKTLKTDKPSLKKDSNFEKGVYKIETNKAKFTKWFTEGGYTTLKDRQKKLAILVGESITENVVNDQINENSNDLNAITKVEMKEFANSLNRQKKEVQGNYSDQYKFSKERVADANYIGKLVKDKGSNKVFDLNTGKLLDKWKKDLNVKNDNTAAEFIYGLVKRNKIIDPFGRDYLQKIYHKLFDAGKRGEAYETAIIDMVIALEKVVGIDKVEAVLRKPTEVDGKPDAIIRLYNKVFNVEVKMADAQYSSVTFAVDKITGKFVIKKDYTFGDKILKELGEGVQQGIELAKARLKLENFNWTDLSTLPTDMYYILKEERVTIDGKEQSYLNAMSHEIPADVSLISELYNKKTKYPVNYIQLMGRGLFYMGGFNNETNVLGTTELQGEATIKLRISSNSKYSVATQADVDLYNKTKGKQGVASLYLDGTNTKQKGETKQKRQVNRNQKTLSWRAIPGIPNSTLENLESNHSIGNIDRAMELMNSPKVKALYKNSKSSEGQKIDSGIIFSRSTNNPTRGITVLDFDDTLATSKSSVLWTAPDGTTGKLTAEEFATQGADLLAQGYVYDFSEFNKVVKGKKAPLFEKALKLQSKFGPENMFILTARPAESAQSIFEFIKANGLNIPLENITGLANSTPEAKALWMAEKVGEGYNDFYFADDALQNVQAVDNILEQFDVKRKVQQARLKFSKGVSEEFNDIIEQTTGIESLKVFSDAQAKIRGAKTKYKSIIPASAQDFMGLLYSFIGKGKKGEADIAFFKKALVDPFARGINELNASKQSAANDYKNLQKQFPEVKKIINKNIKGTQFTNDQAARVYLWNKAGFEVPGLSKRDLKTLVAHVEGNPGLKSYADGIGLISKKEQGYSAPGDYWLAENITSDLLSDGAIGDVRGDFLAEWQENADKIFTPENLNKIEAIYGSKFREALEDVLYRMKTGRNRPSGGGRLMNQYMNWVNNSVGAIMFLNLRSAALQTISATNYVNWSDNNPLKAAAAFGNQKQFWKDFSMIFNSDYLKQRRSGNQRGINEAELSAAVAGAENKAKAALSWLLKKGFLPTQIADSFAISMGGASFYRNRTNKYVKEGMTQEQAEKQAFLDLQETTEVNQQSARPDMISQQQASPLGRLILSFQNTPMQYARIMNKASRDLVNGRGDYKTHISKIIYYGFAQSVLFGALQSAIFASMGDDEEEDFDKKKERILNGMIDSVLSGGGVGGKAISTAKNTLITYLDQRDRGFKADHAYTLLQALSFSPPIGSKLRKIYAAIQTDKFNKDVFLKRGFTLDNPIWAAVGNVIEGITNAPLGRISSLMLQLDNVLDSRNETWKRIALGLGWNTWDLGIKDPDITAIKTEIKKEKKIQTKKNAIIKKEEKKQEKIEENKAVIKKNKEKSEKDGICSAVSKSGKRCKKKAISKGMCTIHESATQNKTGKKSQCKKIKKGGKRCGMQTSNKSGFCYYHD